MIDLVTSQRRSDMMKISFFFIIMVALICTANSQDHLAPGETWTYTRNYTVQESDLCNDIVNNATANATDTCFRAVGPAKDNETIHTIYKADIIFYKVSDRSGEVVDAGDVITYTYYADNTGDVNLTIVSLVDDMIKPVQYRSGDRNVDGKLNPDELWTYEGIYEVKEDDLCSNIINIAVLTATDPCNKSVVKKDRAVVETACIGRICCQDRTNLEGIDAGNQKAIGLQNGNAKNNVNIITNQGE
jgi:hypothetical protein